MELKEVYAALEAAENGAAMVETIKSELAGVRKEAADARIAKNKAEEELTGRKKQHGELETARGRRGADRNAETAGADRRSCQEV